MVQSILVFIVFVVATIYVGRFICRQVTSSGNDAHCDKCIPKQSSEKVKN